MIEYVLSKSDNSKSDNFFKLRTFLSSFIGCLCIVACGIVPAFILPTESNVFRQTEAGQRKLNLLLSFAVGSLLGDVFLHLLPEAWADSKADKFATGIWILIGLLSCFIIEKCCTTTEDSQRKACAIVNLIANFIDNFTHGLAVGGSFVISHKLGILTTFAIIIHELPHEISDFAILLRGNFGKWTAIKAQLVTATGGIFGASVALFFHVGSGMDGIVQHILPFTAGGFLNIALAQILPELLQESNPKESMLQLLLLFGGVAVMGVLGQFC
ncbi:unnamed protein product [Dracunculus medinensis]|uniref:Uncharacterized protein n=1 Tax=Dracunculus medinensis TaxID=318479 RepID=A0A3P7SU04_DRAME|nr:unnamed protein product [Dracunculus medinensis]